MGRDPRSAYAGGYFHVHTRGNDKRRVYTDAIDRRTFLAMLERSQLKYEWVVYAWCLMSTHYHVVLRVPQDGLSAGMCELNGSYARWSNLRHRRSDHVFGKRFTSNEVTTDEHLLEACRYVVLNPVRAGLCADPADWPWSSYRACAGLERAQPFLANDAVLRLFTALFGTRPDETERAYAAFVRAGVYSSERLAVPGTAP